MGSAPSAPEENHVVLGEQEASSAFSKSLVKIQGFSQQHPIESFRDDYDIWVKFSQLHVDVMSIYDNEMKQTKFFTRDAYRGYRYRLDKVLNEAEKAVMTGRQSRIREQEAKLQAQRAQEQKAEERRREREFKAKLSNMKSKLQEQSRQEMAIMRNELANEMKINLMEYKIKHFEANLVDSAANKANNKSRKHAKTTQQPYYQSQNDQVPSFQERKQDYGSQNSPLKPPTNKHTQKQQSLSKAEPNPTDVEKSGAERFIDGASGALKTTKAIMSGDLQGAVAGAKQIYNALPSLLKPV